MPPKRKSTTTPKKGGTKTAKNRQTTKEKGREAKLPSGSNNVVTTPAANPYKGKKYYVVYTLVSGDIEAFDDLAQATEFQADYESLIQTSEKFDTKAKMTAFIATSKKAMAIKTEQTAETPATAPATMSPEDKSKLSRIKSLMDAARPSDSWTFYWKTTPKSKIVIVIFVALNQWNEPTWFVKRQLQAVLVNYNKTTTTIHSAVMST